MTKAVIYSWDYIGWISAKLMFDLKWSSPVEWWERYSEMQKIQNRISNDPMMYNDNKK